MAPEHQIRIAKLTDRDLVEKWMTLAKELGISTVMFLMGDAPLFRNIPAEADESHTEYQELRKFLELDGSELGTRLGLAGHRVDYRRDTPFDFSLATLPDPDKPQLAATTQIFGALKKHFEQVD